MRYYFFCHDSPSTEHVAHEDSLSERFSVLLPSLYTTPEDDLRNLLATQRARQGPSITEEEEELLIAEIRGAGDPSRREPWRSFSAGCVPVSFSHQVHTLRGDAHRLAALPVLPH